MNKRQIISLWSGIGLIVLMILVPPWKFCFTGKLHTERNGPYAPIFAPPEVPTTSISSYENEALYEGYFKKAWMVRIDGSRLLLPVIAIGLLTLALMISFGRRTDQAQKGIMDSGKDKSETEVCKTSIEENVLRSDRPDPSSYTD